MSEVVTPVLVTLLSAVCVGWMIRNSIMLWRRGEITTKDSIAKRIKQVVQVIYGPSILYVAALVTSLIATGIASYLMSDGGGT